MREARHKNKRSDLVASAAKVVALRGLAGSTLGEIADGAGMSANAALYYYPSLKALLEDVQQQVVERFCSNRASGIARISDPVKRLSYLMQNGLPDSGEDQLCRLLYELGAHARSDPTHAARHIALFERQVTLYFGVLEAGAAVGVFRLAGDSMDIARSLVIMEDGLGLHLVNKVPSFDRASALRLMHSHAAIATGLGIDAFANAGDE